MAVNQVTFSSDGRWAATAGWHTRLVRLWDARSGEMRHEWLPEPAGPSNVYFTPDSRELLICRGDEISFWDLETLAPRRLPREAYHYPASSVAFTADGRLMALEMAPGVIHLREVHTGRTVARLEDPHGDRASWLCFTPDGTQLVASAGTAFAIHIWDLRTIRRQLKEIGLDWEWPEYDPPTVQTGGTGIPPLQLELLTRQVHNER